MLNDSRSVLDDGGERATLAIGSFRLDVDTATLYRGNDPLPVGRRAVALLSALAKRQGLVVSKDELIQAAWSGLVVEESNLSVQIAALRKALAAEPGGERWIETLPRRGYRFVGPTSSHHSATDEEKAPPAQGVRLAILSPGAAGGRSQEGSAIARRSRWLVGRNGPLATLDKVTQRMLAGDRQVVFITGEAGIGKTSFIEMAMEQLSRYRVETLCGFCTERFGTNEAFLPLIDSLTTRCRGPDGSAVLEAVRAHAPTWLLQMPGFLDVADRAAFRNEVFGATRERMSREFCDLVEALSVDRPWVLVIEDMHWSDFQTVDVLSRFAHGDRKAQVLVLATYRVGDSIMERTSGSPSASGFGDPREVQRAATRSIVQNRGGAPPRLAFPGREARFGALRADVRAHPGAAVVHRLACGLPGQSRVDRGDRRRLAPRIRNRPIRGCRAKRSDQYDHTSDRSSE